MSQSLFVILLISVFLQSVVTSIPVVVGVLVVMYTFNRSESIFIIALLAGSIVDALSVNRFGISSLLYIVLLSLMYLYERKFEIQTKEYVFLWSLLGSIGYMLLLGEGYVIQQAVASSILAVMLFLLFQRSLNRKDRETI